jgi:hypothetical protein
MADHDHGELTGAENVPVKQRTGGSGSMTIRARRRREEAVRKLVADVQSRTRTNKDDAAAVAETHDWVVASTVAIAIDKNLDRDLHGELVQEA